MKNRVIKLNNFPSIISHASVVGSKERNGPIGALFDYHDESDRFGMSSWEQSEGEMQHLALNLALSKGNLHHSDIDLLLAGDLINQCSSSNYGLIDLPIPFLGLYGACSTCAEALIIGSAFLNSSQSVNKVALVTSSHNCSSERQFRLPIEYGGQRTPTAQWTVTGAGAFVLGEGEGAYITEIMPGISVDMGVKDAANMGAAMAPAVLSTLTAYFDETGHSPTDFDGIFTGDLGYEGSAILLEQMKNKGYDISGIHSDCGLIIYDIKNQDVHAGGSGCGCSASVLSAYILPKLERGEINNIMFIATGALMSPLAIQQGQSIPGIAHLVRICKEKCL